MSKKKYTRDHEWVDINDSVATIGISNHAQESLGDIVFIDLPSVGTRCSPIKRNIMPRVASKSGTFILTINSPFTRPTNAPIKRHATTATKAFCSKITNI